MFQHVLRAPARSPENPGWQYYPLPFKQRSRCIQAAGNHLFATHGIHDHGSPPCVRAPISAGASHHRKISRHHTFLFFYTQPISVGCVENSQIILDLFSPKSWHFVFSKKYQINNCRTNLRHVIKTVGLPKFLDKNAGVLPPAI